MNILVSQDFSKGWVQYLQGNGSVSFSNENKILNHATTGSGANAASCLWNFYANPGDEIEFSVWGKNDSGDSRIALDLVNNNNDTVLNIYGEKVIANEWRKYKGKVTVPYNASGYSLVSFKLGSWSSVGVATTGSFMKPELLVKSADGNRQILASGLIRIQSGAADVHPSFRHFGILGATYNPDMFEVIISLEKRANFNARPMAFATGTPDSISIPLIGNYTVGSSGNPDTVKLLFSNGHERVNLGSGNFYAFISIEL